MLITTTTVLDKLRGKRPTCILLIGAEVYWPLTEYFRERNFSIESERAYSYAVYKFMSWLALKNSDSNGLKSFSSVEVGNGASANLKDVFNSFLHDLQFGTIGSDGDSSGLWWKPANTKSVKASAKRIAEFSDWLAANHETTPINPLGNHASISNQIIAMKSFAQRKAHSMMAHAKSHESAVNDAKITRPVSSPGKDAVFSENVAAFPLDKIDALLWKGFLNDDFKDDPRPWVKWNLRDILITMICLYGGCRESEPLHLWVEDVFEDPVDPESCQVLIHDPAQGLAEYIDPVSGRSAQTSRIDYLNRFCGGKRPLTMETGRRHSGWKGCLLTERKRKAFHVFWIDPDVGKLFNKLWRLYIMHSRPVQPKTPWAFLTKDGQPMGTLAYIDSFKKAVEKIGLECTKWNGTTPHGLRHRYGQWLNELGVDSKEGQICMHHTSVSSQAVYRGMSADDVAQTLRDATGKTKKVILPDWIMGAING